MVGHRSLLLTTSIGVLFREAKPSRAERNQTKPNETDGISHAVEKERDARRREKTKKERGGGWGGAKA